jgi:hypothetical protein
MTANQFNNSLRTTDTYISAGKLITVLYQDWTAGSWANSYKSVVTYNENLIASVFKCRVDWRPKGI